MTIILREDAAVQALVARLLAGLFGAGARRKLRPQILAICFFGLRRLTVRQSDGEVGHY